MRKGGGKAETRKGKTLQRGLLKTTEHPLHSGPDGPLPASRLFLSAKTLTLLSATQQACVENVSLIWPLPCLEVKGHLPFKHGRDFGSSVPKMFFESLVSCKTQKQSAPFPSCHATLWWLEPFSQKPPHHAVFPHILGKVVTSWFFAPGFCGIFL